MPGTRGYNVVVEIIVDEVKVPQVCNGIRYQVNLLYGAVKVAVFVVMSDMKERRP